MPDPTREDPTGGESPDAIEIALGGASGSCRLDRFLADHLEISRAQVRALLGRGAVSLAGRTLGYSDKGLSLPARGALLVSDFRRPEEQRASRQPGPGLRVLAEGPGWLAVDKPAGMPVHPLSEAETDTVLNAVIAQVPGVHGVGEGALRSGVLHRLDVETSGVLLFATEDATWQRLRTAFQEHRVEKRYRAVVAGAFPESNTGPMSFELAVARHRPARVRVVDDAWKVPGRAYPARQTVTVLERFDGATLLEVRIETGFLHQIRVILAHLGTPVLGDALYGDGSALALAGSLGAKRQMLHAARLCFEEVQAASPDPADLAAVLATLRGSNAFRESNGPEERSST